MVYLIVLFLFLFYYLSIGLRFLLRGVLTVGCPIIPASVPNFCYSPTQPHTPALPFEQDKNIRVVDAGASFNLPIPPLVEREGRDYRY